MAGVMTLADARTKVALITVLGEVDLNALTVAQLTAAQDISCDLAKAGTRFSPTASDTISDARFCDEGNPQSLGPSNYEATASVYWYLDPETGQYQAADNAAYEALKEKGTRTIIVLREGPHYTQEWAASDVYDAYEVVSDNPQRPTESGGNVKRIIPLAVQRAALDQVVGAA